MFDHLPTDGVLESTAKVIDIMDKKSGAVVVTSTDSFDERGNLRFRNQSSTFIVGCGNFGGKKEPSSEVVPCVPAPKSKPEATMRLKTFEDQAAIYRLSGDLNPLHIDPNFSILAGYKVPIIHGLCTLGMALRAVLKTYANNDPHQFRAIKVRFTKPVIPGQTLQVDMWKASSTRILFKTTCVETGQEVHTGEQRGEGWAFLKKNSRTTSAIRKLNYSTAVSIARVAVFVCEHDMGYLLYVQLDVQCRARWSDSNGMDREL